MYEVQLVELTKSFKGFKFYIIEKSIIKQLELKIIS